MLYNVLIRVVINKDLTSQGTPFLTDVLSCLWSPCMVLSQEEQKRKEEEEQKRQENELAFQTWLMRKREQIHEERRVQKAQEMESMSFKVCPLDGAI